MSKQTVNHHSASVIIMPATSNCSEFLLAQYDEGYPVQVFRNYFNYIGGNARGDVSPYATLEREVTEEFGWKDDSESVGDIIGTAHESTARPVDTESQIVPANLRETLRVAILSNIPLKQDYRVKVDGKLIGKSADLEYISSVFVSLINPELFDSIKGELRNGRKLVNEGRVIVATTEDIASGRIRGAWGYDRIIKDRFAYALRNSPVHDFLQVTPNGTDKLATYSDYKEFFEYFRDPEVSLPPKK